MIAVIPDPVQTHLALRFDRAIDAIELAAESMKFVIDHYWLPWELDPKADWTDYASFINAKQARDNRESEPGLLIFRWDGKPEEARTTLLYIFLVGETSTSGVNGDQFRKALSYSELMNADHLDPCQAPPSPSNVFCPPDVFLQKMTDTYILGPTSSASLASLAALMEVYGPEKFAIRTTARNPRAIKPAIRKQFSFFERPVGAATSELIDTLVDDDEIDKGRPEQAGGNEVAVLSEASTTLGASLDLDDECCSDKIGGEPSFDILRYPREIASLRNAYGALAAQYPATAVKNGQRPSLSLNLTEKTNSSDEPPDFSKGQSPLSQEATLMAFAAEMQRRHYRYIGINASNTLDIVFLENFLRNAVPDARLFSFDSDLLLEHEPDNTPYIGTLSVTTYPLLYPPLNQLWDQSDQVSALGTHTRLPFTSQREEGLYNAAICTVREMLPSSRSRGFLSERNDCSVPRPPLWLTVLGVGGHWPIQALEKEKVQGPELPRLDLPSSWKAVCILLCAVAAFHIAVLFGVAPFSAKFREFKLGTVAPARQLLGIHTASATLALALVMVAISAWKHNPWSLFSILFSGLLLVPCYLLTRKYFRWWSADEPKAPDEWHLRPRPYKATLWLQGFVFLLIWSGAVWLAGMWWTLLRDPMGHYGDFFSLRALHLVSIVSPLAPLVPLLASLYIGAIFYVWHLAFNDKIRPRLNPSWAKSPNGNKWLLRLRQFFFEDEPEPSPALLLDDSCEKTTLRMRARQLLWECKSRPPLAQRHQENALRPGLRTELLISEAVNHDVQNIIVGLIILGLWLLIFRQPQFELFERHAFQWLFETLFSLVMLLILVSGFRLLRIWQKLRRFLQGLNRQRAGRVFSHLKLKGWTSLWFYGSEDPDWDDMLRSFEVLQELWHSGERPSCSEAVDAIIKYIRSIRWDLQKEGPRAFHPFEIAPKDGELESAISDAEDLLAATLNDVLDRVVVIWGNQRFTDEGRRRQKLLEKYAALRWFSFIRAVVARIRSLILFLTIGFSLALISLVIYSFEPHQELLWSVTALFITIGLLVVIVLVQMHRDPILSRITGTKPGALDPTFYVRLVGLGVTPVLTLLATHFPSIGRSLLSFLQPGLEAMK